MAKLSLPKVSLNTGLKHVGITVIASLFIYGCGSTPKTVKRTVLDNTVIVGQVNESATKYLMLSQQARGIKKQALELNAFRASLISTTPNQQALIAAIFSRLSTQQMLSDAHKMEWQLTQSMRLLELSETESALSVLAPKAFWDVTPSQWFNYLQFQSTQQVTQQQIIPALESLSNAYQYAETQQQTTQLSQAIWPLLNELEPQQLEHVPQEDIQLAGWKALAIITHQSMHSPSTLKQQVQQWVSNNPNHVAATNLPKNLELMLSVTAFAPQKIALLLPLSGKYSRLGQAVQHGIVSNLIAHNTQQELMTFDTIELGVAAAMEQAMEQGAEFVLGPLLKHHVAQISALDYDIPTLFLNHASTPLLVQQFSFSLAKEAEVLQGTEHIFNQGKKHPVIVAPNNAQGHKIARLFSEKWLALNEQDLAAKPVEAFFFENDAGLKKTVEKLFETDSSQGRINHMRLLVGNKMKSETRSRRDIDAIYLVANPKQTGMLMPSVEVTVSAFAPQVSVYVGSSGNNQLDTNQNRSHLNNLTLSDIPWFLQRPASISPQYVKKLWPEIKQSQMRLFAMGYDAYGLITRLAQMSLFPHFNLDGLSGTLSLNKERDIIRKIAWAQYQRGKLIKQ